MRQEALLTIKPAIEALLERQGYVLVDLRYYKNHYGQHILEILVDRAEGGITLDECTRLSKELNALVELQGEFGESYMLDVSSPGMDRPLVTAADFRRVQDRELRFFLKEAWEGKNEYQGTLESVDENQITIKTKDKTIRIPLDKMNKAKQVIV